MTNSQHTMVALATCDNGNTIADEITRHEDAGEFAPALSVLREQGLIK